MTSRAYAAFMQLAAVDCFIKVTGYRQLSTCNSVVFISSESVWIYFVLRASLILFVMLV